MQTTCVIALDFDGVLCDSAAETAQSGWKAGHEFWPERFPLPISLAMIQRFCEVRPILKTGYDSIAMLHMLQRGVSAEKMLNDGLAAVNIEIANLGRSKGELQEAFGRVRDRWIAEDYDGWLSANRFYGGPLEAAKACRLPAYVITTKQTRFAVALCRHAGFELPESRIFGLEFGEKSGVLTQIQSQYPGVPVAFVEDRLNNLMDARVPDEANLHRFYADWGYGTENDRDMAVESPQVTVIDPTQFTRLLSDPVPFLS